MSMSTPLAKVRGLGSAREGVAHWKWQRLTAIANLFLVLWFVASAVGLSGAGYEQVRAWLEGPVNATLMVLLLISSFWHARLGVQVVIEDYVHHEGAKVASLVAATLVMALLGAMSVLAVLKIFLGG